jgi:hypothetical protein
MSDEITRLIFRVEALDHGDVNNGNSVPIVAHGGASLVLIL